MDYQVVLKIDHVDTEKCSVVLRELRDLLRKAEVAANISVSVNGKDSPDVDENAKLAGHIEDLDFLKYAAQKYRERRES